jgi:hypothetical protein
LPMRFGFQQLLGLPRNGHGGAPSALPRADWLRGETGCAAAPETRQGCGFVGNRLRRFPPPTHRPAVAHRLHSLSSLFMFMGGRYKGNSLGGLVIAKSEATWQSSSFHSARERRWIKKGEKERDACRQPRSPAQRRLQ